MKIPNFSRRSLLSSVAAGALGFVFRSAKAEGSQRKPNILILLTDDQNWKVVGYEGHPLAVTPNIDRIAQTGVAFRNSFVTTPICASSRATLYSGTYLAHHGFNFSMPGLPEEILPQLFPTLLREAGYRTGLIGKLGIWFDQSTLEKVGKRLGLVAEDAGLFDVLEMVGREPYISEDEDGVMRHSLDKVELRALRFLDQQSKDKPFCLVLSFNEPHITPRMDGQGRYEPAEEDRDLFPDAKVPLSEISDPKVFEALPAVLKPEIMASPEEAGPWLGLDPTNEYVNYFRLIGGVDRVIGSVLEKLDAIGAAEDTVIIFTSDNGLSMGDRRLAGKWTHFDESIRVPLAIYDPKERRGAGTRPDAFALNVDLPSTILDYAGIDTPAEYRGRSLRPFVRGQTPEDWREEFYCEQLDYTNLSLPDWIGIRSEKYSYAEYFFGGTSVYFLTDANADPLELENLADDPDHAGKFAEYRDRARRLRKEYSL